MSIFSNRPSKLLKEFDKTFKKEPQLRKVFYSTLGYLGIEMRHNKDSNCDMYRIDGGKWRKVDNCFHTYLQLVAITVFRRVMDYSALEGRSECLDMLKTGDNIEAAYLSAWIEWQDLNMNNTN